jgi:hypothetical protein
LPQRAPEENCGGSTTLARHIDAPLGHFACVREQKPTEMPKGLALSLHPT